MFGLGKKLTKAEEKKYREIGEKIADLILPTPSKNSKSSWGTGYKHNYGIKLPRIRKK